MAFTPTQKLEVKKKAHFKCCVCWSFEFIHVHHVIPESEGGPDTIDNAAPLCTKHHDTFGANPEKRKWIREKRDFWYDYCEKKLYREDVNQLEKTYAIIEKTQAKHEDRLKTIEQDMGFLQQTVHDLVASNQSLISNLDETPEEKKPEAYALIGSASSTISGSAIVMTQLSAGVYANAICPKCGSSIGLSVSNQPGPPKCPQCGTQMQ